MKNLIVFLEEMAGLHDENAVKGSNTVSWKAYRAAEKLNDLTLTEQLIELIDNHKDEKVKQSGYQVLAYLLQNTRDQSLANILLERLTLEKDNNDRLYILLTGLRESNMQFQENIENVIYFIDDDREMIRNAAIRVLGHYKADKSKAINALNAVIDSPYDTYDLKYAKQALKKLAQ